MRWMALLFAISCFLGMGIVRGGEGGLFQVNIAPPPHGESATQRIRQAVGQAMEAMRAGRYAGAELIGRLYTLRIFADYRPSVEVDGRDAREAISIMNTIFDSF